MERKKVEHTPAFKLGEQSVYFSNAEITQVWLGLYTQLGVKMRRERIVLAKQLDQLDQKIEQNHKDVTHLTKDLQYHEGK